MVDSQTRDVEYTHDGSIMNGLVCAPQGAQELPTVVLIHDAFGLGKRMIGIAEDITRLGYAAFAADMWGNRLTPQPDDDIGALIGGLVSDRPRWHDRIAAAHRVAGQQPEADPDAMVALGYCFGGSSALEHLRTGGHIRGAASIHGGLDLLEFDWSGANNGTQVLVSTGDDDPMATADQRRQLQESMTGAGIDWEVNLYSDTKHAFTSPDASASGMPEVGFHPRNAQRSWEATTRFLREVIPATAAG